jgi:hypothetical protein
MGTADDTGRTPHIPAHFAASIGWSGREPIADDHGVWRLIGAWIATRQRGDAELIRPFAAAGVADQVVGDAAQLMREGGGALATGGELDVSARARQSADGAVMRELDIVLTGRVTGADGADETRVSHLAIAEVALDADDGQWRITALLDDAARRLMALPDFARFMEQQRSERR